MKHTIIFRLSQGECEKKLLQSCPLAARLNGMDYQTPEEVIALIEAAGGTAELGKRMGFRPETARQRVSNWRASGKIPEMVVRAYSHLFRKIMAKAKKETV